MPVKTNLVSDTEVRAALPPTTSGKESEIVAHYIIIDKINEELTKAGYKVTGMEYKASANRYIVNGLYFIHKIGEEEHPSMTPVFMFTNNYEHSNEFCCTFGVNFQDIDVISLPEQLVRTPHKVKFTEKMAMERIEQAVSSATIIQLGLATDQIDFMESSMTPEAISEMIGSLYLMYNALSVTQLTWIKKKLNLDKSQKDCNVADVYAVINERIVEEAHPRVVMDNLSIVHRYFTNNVNNSSRVATPAPVVNSTPVPVAAPISEYVSPMPSVVFL
jgi:hypothetical protein